MNEWELENTMPLADLLNNEPETGRQCRFGPWLETLKEDDRNAVLQAFDNRTTSISHIIRVLQAIGCQSSSSSIRSHIKNECVSCKR